MQYRRIAIAALALAVQAAGADTVAITADGRKVLLRDDGTWQFEQPAAKTDGEPRAALTLENRIDLPHGCRLGLRLQNDLSAQVRTLVLRFTAYKGEGIPFETVSRGFSYIKPTASQYQEITFRGIGCAEICAVQVAAARNCHVGEMTKYSASEERCLELIEVAGSSLLPIAKGPAAP